MQRLQQVVLAITVMVAQALPAPAAMTCLLRISQGFGAEHSCCRHMRSICGNESKSSSAGCCVRKTDGGDLQAISPKPFSFDHEMASIGPAIPFDGGMNLHRADGVSEWLQAHPPGPDSSLTTHLRI